MLFFVLLCLIWMSEDANSVFSETLHVSQNIGTVLHNFSADDRAIIRRLEGLQKKHTNARYAVIFTETHRYIYIYILGWGESTIFHDQAPRQVDLYVYRHPECSGDVRFWLALHTFIARRFSLGMFGTPRRPRNIEGCRGDKPRLFKN